MKYASLIVLAALLTGCAANTEKSVREPVFAGSWYPGDNAQLDNTIATYFNNVKKLDFNGTIKAIIVPHAGYAYSGQIAATAFRQLDSEYENVFLLGPSHRYPLRNAAVTNYTYYKTPLGKVKISDKAKQLTKESIIFIVPEAEAQEHSIEIELPFLQKKLANFELVPIIVGDIDSEQFKNVLLKYLGEDDLIVVSADMSHYHPYDEARKLDSYSLNSIINLDADGIMQAEIDAPWAAATLLKIAKEKKWKPEVLYYANSGDVTGDKSSVVGYSATVFIDKSKKITKTDNLTTEDKEFLLKLARDTLEGYLKNGKKPSVDEGKLSPALKKVQGCFTTLNKNAQLRGCIGHILPQEELYKCVMDNAINAAVNDPRFPAVSYDELKDIEIEISVLSVPQRLEFSSGDELKKKLRPLVDGVVLRNGFRQSTYLPQVWEQLADKEEFLMSLCEKGGMQPDCWKDTSTEVQTYQAIVFSEKE